MIVGNDSKSRFATREDFGGNCALGSKSCRCDLSVVVGTVRLRLKFLASNSDF